MNKKTNSFRSWTVINLDNYRFNIQQFKKFLNPETEIMQIVKADAYGHGSTEIAREAEKVGINWLGVANSDEGVLLRLENIKSRILILSPSFPTEIDDIITYQLTTSISDIKFAELLNRKAKENNAELKVHINFDTGMGRDGFLYTKANELIDEFSKFSNLKIEGIFSHFAMSELTDSDFSEIQYERLEKILAVFNSAGKMPKIQHISNSAAVVNYPQYNLDLVRLGLMSYGIYPHSSLQSKINLKPVMKFESKIGQVKELPAKFGISYNRTYVTKKSTKTAIIPVGYGDGYNFMLSNLGQVVIHNRLCPILGRVTMDMLIVDVSKLENVQIGDDVILLGDDDKSECSAEELSKLYHGLSYEILSNLGRRAQRIFVKENADSKIEPISRRNFIANDFSDDKLEKIIQTSLNQRLNSNEIGSNVYHQMLENLFSSSDKGVQWKKNFVHSVKFYPAKRQFNNNDKYYRAKTHLHYFKELQYEKFKIVCATSMNDLGQYFLRPDIEYRWLLDFNKDLFHSFTIDRIMINDIVLEHKMVENGIASNLEFECFQPELKSLVGKEVKFTIDTTTFYPKSKHQLSIYLSELTKEISIEFDYSGINLENVEIISIFAGKEKYPQEIRKNGKIILRSNKDEWFFPHSGVVFVW